MTDDTAAIQAAINAEDSVFIPPGTYRITSPISIPQRKVLRGVGYRSHGWTGNGTWAATAEL